MGENICKHLYKLFAIQMYCKHLYIYVYTHTHTLWSWFHKYIYVSKVAHFKYVQFVKHESHSVMSNYCDPMDYTVYGILQDKILEWVTVPSSRGSSWPRNWTGISHMAGDSSTVEQPGKHTLNIYVHFIVCQLYLIKLLQHNGREMNPSNDFSCSSPQDLQPNCPGHY